MALDVTEDGMSYFTDPLHDEFSTWILGSRRTAAATSVRWRTSPPR